jgi:hypothetical protein
MLNWRGPKSRQRWKLGREAEGNCRWQGMTGWSKALLEGNELILRGGIKARIARTELSDWHVAADELVIRVGADTLYLDIGADEARRWVLALNKPVPTLAQKLGIDADHRAFLLGGESIAELDAALNEKVAETPDQARTMIAVLKSLPDLEAAISLGKSCPELPIWCVYQKGAVSPVTEAKVRTALRNAGYHDVKVSGISAEWTATRFLPARDQPARTNHVAVRQP